MPAARRAVSACLTAGALAFALALPAAAAEPVFGAFDDDPRPLQGWDAATAEAGKDAAKLAKLAQDLVAVLGSATASAGEKQDAAEHLGPVLRAQPANQVQAILRTLTPLLANEQNFEYARLALDRVPGEAVDALYLETLPQAKGLVRVALVQSIGDRSIASAIPALRGLINDADAATAGAAITALGRIGGKSALEVLQSAKDAQSLNVLNAKLAAAKGLSAADRAKLAEQIYQQADAPLAARAAALRTLIDAQPKAAVKHIRAALEQKETIVHEAAIAAVGTLPASGAAAELAKSLSSLAPSVQAALITALGTLGDAAARPALLEATSSSDAEVRLAAIAALARLPGDTKTAEALAKLAAGSSAEARAAAESLGRIHGPGIDEFVQKNAGSGEPALRAAFIAALAERNLTQAIPQLLGMRKESAASVRLAALDALRVLATEREVQAIIDWAVGAADKNEETRAVRALITTLLRQDDVDTRARPVVAALQAGPAKHQLALLPVLPRVAGPTALAAAKELALGQNSEVAVAATGELARWPDAAALPALVEVAQKIETPAVRTAAVRAASRFLGQRKQVSRDERAAPTLALLELPLPASDQNTLLRVLSTCRDPRALEVARKFAQEQATAAEARDAVEAITANLAGPPDFKASAASADVAKVSDDNMDTIWLVPNRPDTLLSVDLKHVRPVHRIILDPGEERSWGYPRQLEVFISETSTQPDQAALQVEGERGETVLSFPAGTRARYVWLKQVGTRDAPWVIAELVVE